MAAKTEQIRAFIIAKVRQFPKSIVRVTAEEFQISRQAAHRHVAALVKEGTLFTTGNTRRTYQLVARHLQFIPIEIRAGVEEHAVWNRTIQPAIKSIPKNVEDICFYGFTEMFNNVIDHSAASNAIVALEITANDIEIRIADNGVGIFKKIAAAFGLDDIQHSLLELSKGKLTTDPRRHTGEGIFFTSRAFDLFAIVSGGLKFIHRRDEDDWLSERPVEADPGTSILMRIGLKSEQTLESVFGKFSGGESNDYGFRKTHVPLRLAQFGSENLVSRSQAKRVLNRFDRFDEIILDFDGIDTIGQAFADEIFRVYAMANKRIKIFAIRTSAQVRGMINRALAEAERQR